MIEISIIICTYNRLDLLKRCIESLEPALSDERVELIVVDNNSTDKTPEYLHRLIRDRKGKNLRAVREQNQGLSFARNRGSREAAGVFVAFLDDDALVDEAFLPSLRHVIPALEPDVVCFGGRILPLETENVPDWVPDHLRLKGRDDSSHRTVTASEAVWLIFGSNMVLKREALLQVGGFATTLGRQGSRQGVGEETDLFCRIGKLGRFRYAPEIVVYHPATLTDVTIGKLLQREWYKGMALQRYRTVSALEAFKSLCVSPVAAILAGAYALKDRKVHSRSVVNMLVVAAGNLAVFAGFFLPRDRKADPPRKRESTP